MPATTTILSDVPRMYHAQSDIDSDKFLAILNFTIARNLTISILGCGTVYRDVTSLFRPDRKPRRGAFPPSPIHLSATSTTSTATIPLHTHSTTAAMIAPFAGVDLDPLRMMNNGALEEADSNLEHSPKSSYEYRCKTRRPSIKVLTSDSRFT